MWLANDKGLSFFDQNSVDDKLNSLFISTYDLASLGVKEKFTEERSRRPASSTSSSKASMSLVTVIGRKEHGVEANGRAGAAP